MQPTALFVWGLAAGGCLGLAPVGAQSLSGSGLPGLPAPAGEPGWRLGLALNAAVVQSRNPRFALGLDAGADTLYQLSPALTLSGRDGVFSGQAQYAADLYTFAQASEGNDVRHSLRSAFRADLVRDRFQIDAAVLHGQQTLSAFSSPVLTSGVGGAVAQGSLGVSNLFNPNISPVTTLQVAPLLRGRLPGGIDLEARYQRSHIDIQNAATGAQDADAVQLRLSGGAGVQWAIAGAVQRQVFESGRSLQTESAQALVSHSFVPEFTARLGAGAERRNFESSIAGVQAGQASPFLRAGLAWTPTPRTAMALDIFDRYFGTGWLASASHRTGRLAIRLGAARTVVDGTYSIGALASQIGSGTTITAGDLYSQLLAAQEPDPAKREALLSQTLAARGLDAQSPISGISGSQGPNLQNRLELGWLYTLPRQTITLQALRSRSERILRDPLNPGEDLARFGGVTQSAVQIAVAHRLTQDSTLALTATRLKTEADTAAAPTELTQSGLTYSTRLGSQSTLAIGLREGRYRNPNLVVASAAVSTGIAAIRRDASLAVVFSTRF